MTDPLIKDLVFLRYSDMIAQSIYFAMYTSYPKSRCDLSEDFRRKIMDIICDWTTGIQCASYNDSHWKMVPEMITKKVRNTIQLNNITTKSNVPLSTKSLEEQLNKKFDAVDRAMKAQMINGNAHENDPFLNTKSTYKKQEINENEYNDHIKSFYVGKYGPANRASISYGHSKLIDHHLKKYGEVILSRQNEFPITITEFPHREEKSIINNII